VGLGTWDQYLSIKRQPKVLAALVEPTAQALLALSAVMPLRTVPDAVCSACFHALPFQRRMKLFVSPVPMAQALLADVAVTAARDPPPAGVGLGTFAQDFPFQRAVSVVSERVPPTAHASSAEKKCME